MKANFQKLSFLFDWQLLVQLLNWVRFVFLFFLVPVRMDAGRYGVLLQGVMVRRIWYSVGARARGAHGYDGTGLWSGSPVVTAERSFGDFSRDAARTVVSHYRNRTS